MEYLIEALAIERVQLGYQSGYLVTELTLTSDEIMTYLMRKLGL